MKNQIDIIVIEISIVHNIDCNAQSLNVENQKIIYLRIFNAHRPQYFYLKNNIINQYNYFKRRLIEIFPILVTFVLHTQIYHHWLMTVSKFTSCLTQVGI